MSGLYALPKICENLAPLQKDKAMAALDIACHNKARELRYNAPRISSAVVGLLLSLAPYTEDPGGIWDLANIFLLSDLYFSAGSEAVPLVRQ